LDLFAVTVVVMRFAKYHGIGNDFIFFADPDDRLTLSAELVRGLCDRRFGVGGDGVIRVAPGRDGGELFMDYMNSDGSVGEMCGNGIRCLALFARAEGLTSSTEIKVDTRAGLKLVEVLNGSVRVDMGAPIFEPARIPVAHEGSDALTGLVVPVPRNGPEELNLACLSMGNPHAVAFVEEPNEYPVTAVGPYIENHELFPSRTNVEFVRVESPDRIRMRVWERGSGETLACGTGACAGVVAARLLRGAAETVTVVLPGGELEVEWKGSPDKPASVHLTGPVVKSYEGELDLETYS
jgi:diaminopimelate epimerase